MKSGVCSTASRHLSVLFVDDDTDTLFAYRLLSREEGMSVEIAGDGQVAISLANLVVPDVVVLDIGLRSADGLDGYEVARRLRASPTTRAIPIIIVSGYNSARDEAAIKASGCDGHLVKPCSAEALFGLIRDVAMRRNGEAASSTPRASKSACTIVGQTGGR